MIPRLFFNVLVSLVCKHPFSYSARNLKAPLWIYILKTWRVFIEILFTISRSSVFSNFFIRSWFNKVLHLGRTGYLEASEGRVLWSFHWCEWKGGGDRADGLKQSLQRRWRVGSGMERETCDSAVLGALWEKPPIWSIRHLWGYLATAWCLGTDTVFKDPSALLSAPFTLQGLAILRPRGWINSLFRHQGTETCYYFIRFQKNKVSPCPCLVISQGWIVNCTFTVLRTVPCKKGWR